MKYVTDIPNQFKKAHETDAGYDILAAEDKLVLANSRELIKTGLKVAIPECWVGIICARSGLSIKHRLDIAGGIIDSGYTGEVGVCLVNNGIEPYKVTKGDKIAQMIVTPIFRQETHKVKNLEETKRGAKGFNSTGY